MSFLLIFMYGIFTLAAVYFALLPFLKSREDQARLELIDDEIREVELLVARKNALLRSLRELEYDQRTEKIAEDDYQRFKLKLERQAIGVMRELDAVHGGKDWREEVDVFVASNLPDLTVDPTSRCQSCNATLEADDRFCAKCGARVALEVIEGQEATS